MKIAQDEALKTTTHVQWSSDGLAESGSLARTALAGDPKLNAGSTANPSVVSNNGAFETAAASAAVDITHFAFAADAALTTTWIALDETVPLLEGGKISVADTVLAVDMYQATDAPA